MWTEQAMVNLSDNTAYCRDDLFHLFSDEKKGLSDGAFRWTLYNLLRDQKIFRTDYDTYSTVKPRVLPVYKPYYSEKAGALIKKLEEQYPKLKFKILQFLRVQKEFQHLQTILHFRKNL